MTLKMPAAPPPPSWPQVLMLMGALSGASLMGGKTLGAADVRAEAPTTISARAAHTDDALLIETLGKLQASVEKLTDQVQTLNTKVAVIEDRQKRAK